MVVGDQLTCKVIRGCKLWRMSEPEIKDRLVWVEIPGRCACTSQFLHIIVCVLVHILNTRVYLLLTGDFHFMWECLKVLFLIFWGTHSLPGSLCNMREIISRNLVDKEAKVFSIADEFILHVFQAHFQAAICSFFDIASTSPLFLTSFELSLC